MRIECKECIHYRYQEKARHKHYCTCSILPKWVEMPAGGENGYVSLYDLESECQAFTPHINVKCPLCGADNSNAYGPVEIDGSTAWQEASCSACGGSWNEFYEYTGWCGVK